MRFAISIPQHVSRDGFDPDAFRAHLARMEELGFESAWTQELVFSSARAVAPLELMTFAAACTERLRIGCVVFVSPLHSPVHLAKDLSSIDVLSRGRLEAGFGTGGRSRPFAAFGISADRLVARFTEGIALIRACWTEPEINFDGQFWQVEGASMEPKPVQKPHPPIWIGGNHPDALARAVRIGDGFFGAGSQTTAQFVEQSRVIREELARQERALDSFQIAKRVYIQVDENTKRARQKIDAALTYHYGSGGLQEVAVVGPPAACVEGLREVQQAGAELILLNTLVDDAEQMERLAAEVVPELT
jgi:probable F420-dependent oxidoreductase